MPTFHFNYVRSLAVLGLAALLVCLSACGEITAESVAKGKVPANAYHVKIERQGRMAVVKDVSQKDEAKGDSYIVIFGVEAAKVRDYLTSNALVAGGISPEGFEKWEVDAQGIFTNYALHYPSCNHRNKDVGDNAYMVYLSVDGNKHKDFLLRKAGYDIQVILKASTSKLNIGKTVYEVVGYTNIPFPFSGQTFPLAKASDVKS